MKKFAISLIAIFIASSVIAQTFYVDIDATAKRKIKDTNSTQVFEKGDKFTISKVGIIEDHTYGEHCYIFTTSDSKIFQVNLNKLDSTLDLWGNDVQGMWDAYMCKETLPNIINAGYQYELRQDMEMEALQFVSTIEENNLKFDDPYLESYIYGLVHKIAPTYLLDGRTTDINILLNRDPSINASCFPNGTIVINLGLLALLHSEAEVVAILSHEIAHYLLDHHIQNLNAQIEREQRAAFWGAFATGIAAIADIAIGAHSNGYYIPGGLTSATAIIASTIAEDSVERLGMEYNYEQELKADAIAVEVLKALGYDPNALATALNRVKMHNIRERDNSVFIDGESHPSLNNRINNAGTPTLAEGLEFEQIMSFAITDLAATKFSMGRFRQAIEFVDQNIENNVATADDYLLKARCLLNLLGNGESINDVIYLINCAKAVDPSNINIYKTEIIAYLKSGDIVYAQHLLDSYNNRLSELSNNDLPSNLYYYIADEADWASKMLIKIEGMLKGKK